MNTTHTTPYRIPLLANDNVLPQLKRDRECTIIPPHHPIRDTVIPLPTHPIHHTQVKSTTLHSINRQVMEEHQMKTTRYGKWTLAPLGDSRAMTVEDVVQKMRGRLGILPNTIKFRAGLIP